MTQETGGFAAFNLNPNILAAVAATGYEEPSAIQQQSIPIIMAGHDMIGQAQTGTGKTAAFALPILHRIDPAKREPQALILAPTRELALQVATAFETYAKQMPGVNVIAVYGGAPMGPQLKAIRNGAQIIVATPGRLVDHMRRDEKVLSTVRHLVLDEADEMLKLGFMDDLEVIFKGIPAERQTVLFSATLPQSIRAIAERHLRDPQHVKIQTKTQTVTAIEQAHLLVHADQKTSAVLSLLEVEDFDALIMFVRTKQATLDLASALEAKGYKAAALNGDIAQNQRERVIDSLKDGRLDIVVATDVAARGLDVPRITHVFNVDMPYDPESYVHRIGRTGRAGRKGEAILFVAPRERRMLRAIEHATRQAIEPMKMPSTEDINQHRLAKFKERIRETMMGEELEIYVNLVNELIEEDSADPLELAAALAKLVQGDQPLLLDDSITEPASDRAGREFERRDFGDRAPRDFGDRGDRPARRMPSLEPRPLKDNPDVEMERYRVDVGAHHGVKPGQIVGAIANEANIESRFIGNIDIADDFSTVDLPKGMTADVLEVIKKARVCQRPLQITRYTEVPAGSNTAPRPPRSDRPFNKDRRPSGDRPFNKSGERREGGFNKDRKFGGNKRRDS